MEVPKPLIVVCDTLMGPGAWTMLDDLCGDLLRALHTRARVLRPATSNAFLDALKQKPRAVLLTEPEILKKNNPGSPHAALLAYTRAGGTTVICGPFSNNAEYDVMKRFYAAWGLQWTLGDYLRTTHAPAAAFQDEIELAKSYNVKAQLMHAPPDQRVYVPVENARQQSHVFAPVPVDAEQAAVVRGACGSGTLAFVGDVNCEVGSTRVCLWLAGLPIEEPPKAPVKGFSTFNVRVPRENARTLDGVPERTVAIGRGGSPFVWRLLVVEPNQTLSMMMLSSPPSLSDSEPRGSVTISGSRPGPLHPGGVPFSTPLAGPGWQLLWNELSRVGMVDRGGGVTIHGGGPVAMDMEVLVPVAERVRWCAGCSKWEKRGSKRFLRCSGCEARFYCSPKCQKEDWLFVHKSACRLLKDGKEAEAAQLIFRG
ncbi:hypothetical protein EXIGLDRAFT_779198 [Exidia glandulosa HHB12029]|uniref:MYND-type domain-containing protein n=1 Tax=Exidia glandulosa HHB12029 TaxID=1314781 RepID=A0A165C6D9_EXIGL|nr:hypothetical protein EXIGLDRAFT_779198 [Exidia glandulosa HHB12029]